jgi:hypothetical protein
VKIRRNLLKSSSLWTEHDEHWHKRINHDR